MSQPHAVTTALQHQQHQKQLQESSSDAWTNKCVDYVERIIRFYRTNDMSHLTPQMIMLINTIRDLCVESHPISVNVVKRFDSDENLIKHYSRLRKELGGSEVAENIFQPSFVYNVLPSYAQKFYNKGAENVSGDSVSEAAHELGEALQYQIAEAVASNTPIPLPVRHQLVNTYITLLLQRANIPPNVQDAVSSRKYPTLNIINDLINNVIDDVFTGVYGNYYYYVLNEKNRARIVTLKENIGFLAPLSASTDIFQYIANLATRAGKRPSLFQGATFLNAPSSNGSNVEQNRTSCQQSLTELAFQNEALRRYIFQKLSYKQNY
ncbi:gp41 [Helicoverpa armigera nucleopolyhedrovirus]|uniref:Glycoprotein 41 n=6 Tax=Alphabaculovirus helarmigerae TaxID=3047947 RepID=Q77K67_9ABAC|nr:gp41 [Helicoverpa armigera nucleopolyhedrovirus G4]NP_203628.1 P40 [Helicoverpa armigera nucleopolyhedrovirus]AAL56081.1 ORF75 [Helicoverpa zea single nucleopolyhedrovirus]AEN03996.1 glycoprotein GP41 [Helicoverpa armigera NPV strain Australia]AIG63115.1 GP41 [Helicoverpa SNPV AC53]AIG63253.1 GP41 [Helicoverpa armigera SNPV]AXR98060.1 P40 [Helicoverpa assulta nucleopolyhedrovirus]BAG74640.1 occlusion-derived virus glycoprotein [Helicoverpa armigera NPV NNg1]